MKILLLCNKPPYPPKDGGALAIQSMIDGLLSAGHQVKVLAANAPKYGIKEEDIPRELRQATRMELISVPLAIRPLPLLMHCLRGNSYHVIRFYSPVFARRLTEVLSEGFDIVQYETVFPAVYHTLVRKHSHAAVVLRAHNIEHHIWEQLAAAEPNIFKRWVLRKLASTLKRFELSLFGKVDGIAAITKRETAFVELHSCKTPVRTIPFGMDASRYPFPDSPEKHRHLFHIGAMHWMPNVEGIQWFLQEVWPSVQAHSPDIKLELAGRNMPASLSALHSDHIRIKGEVDDAWQFILSGGIMVVPLHSGSGIRIKVVEGMLAGKPVITTTKGAEGIDGIPGIHFLIADTAQDFVRKILHLIDQPEQQHTIGKAARTFILNHYSMEHTIPELNLFYQELRNDG